MFCPHCGGNIPDSSQICDFCDSQLTTAQPEPVRGASPKTHKKRSKKPIIAIVSTLIVLVVASFLVFFFACGGFDTAAQTSIVDNYVKAVERGDALAAATLYHPVIIEEEGYEINEYDEFVLEEDFCYDRYCGKAVKSSEIDIYTLKEYLNALFDAKFEDYDGPYSEDEIEEYRESALSEIDELEDAILDEVSDSYGIEVTDIAIGVADVSFENGDTETYILVLLKVEGIWYIGSAT